MKDNGLYEDFVSGRVAGLYRRFFRPLMSFASRYLGAEYAYLAEDVVQESIFQTYLKKERIENPTALKAYLYHSVRNAALNILRKKKAQQNYLRNFDESDTDITHRIIEEETFRILMETIGALDPEQREMLNMTYFEGLKNAEIAERLGLSEIAVKKRKAKLIETLRQLLSDKGLGVLALAIILSRISSNLPS